MKQPFFVRFLENQKFPEVQTDIHAGKPPKNPETMKYPSDGDEGDPI